MKQITLITLLGTLVFMAAGSLNGQNVTGSGEVNYIPRWISGGGQHEDGISTSILGNSNIYDLQGLIGIGTITPISHLHLIGDGIFEQESFPETPFTRISIGHKSSYTINNSNLIGYLGFNLVSNYNGYWYRKGDGLNNGGAAMLTNSSGYIFFATIPSSGGSDPQGLTDSEISAKIRMTITPSGNVALSDISVAHANTKLFVNSAKSGYQNIGVHANVSGADENIGISTIVSGEAEENSGISTTASGEAEKNYGLNTKAFGGVDNYGIYSQVDGEEGHRWAGYFYHGDVEVNSGDFITGGVYKRFIIHTKWWESSSHSLIIAPENGGNWDWQKSIQFNDDGLFIAHRMLVVGSNTLASPPQIPVGAAMAIDGKLYAREIEVNAATWPDYVFSTEYKLRSLEELEKFIIMNNHLPDVPSEKEVKEKGVINLGEMDALLMKKVEELTLYIIDLKKEIKTLREKNN